MAPRYSIIPGSASYDKRLTDFDVRVLACIGRHTSGGGWCFLKQTKMATALGKSREAVNRSVSKLVKFKYLEKVDVRSPNAAKEHGVRRQDLCYYRTIMDGALPPIGEDAEYGIEVPEEDLVMPGSQAPCDATITSPCDATITSDVTVGSQQEERSPLDGPSLNGQRQTATAAASSDAAAAAASASPVAKSKTARKGNPRQKKLDIDTPKAEAPGRVSDEDVKECFAVLFDAMKGIPEWENLRPSSLQKSGMRQLIQSEGKDYVFWLAEKLKTAKFARGEDGSEWVISLNKLLFDPRKRDEVAGIYQRGKRRPAARSLSGEQFVRDIHGYGVRGADVEVIMKRFLISQDRAIEVLSEVAQMPRQMFRLSEKEKPDLNNILGRCRAVLGLSNQKPDPVDAKAAENSRLSNPLAHLPEDDQVDIVRRWAKNNYWSISEWGQFAPNHARCAIPDAILEAAGVLERVQASLAGHGSKRIYGLPSSMGVPAQ